LGSRSSAGDRDFGTILGRADLFCDLPMFYVAPKHLHPGAVTPGKAMVILHGTDQRFITTRQGEVGLLQKRFGLTVVSYLYMFLTSVHLQRNLGFVERVVYGRGRRRMGA
jgi:hypothetical protein